MITRSKAFTFSGEKNIDEGEEKRQRSSTAPTPPPTTPPPAGPLSPDAIDGGVLKAPRSPKPRKPLPKLPTDVKTNETPQSWIVDMNNNISEDEEDEEVEVQIQYSFIRKIRLPKGFSVSDLKANAAKQSIPSQLEFRY